MAVEELLAAFRTSFSDERLCAAYLRKLRWPDGFVCPSCRSSRGVHLNSRAYTYECLACGHQTSITAHTVIHRSKLPLTLWFAAAFVIAIHPDGVSARRLQELVGITYKTAWLLKQKLKRSMDEEPLTGHVELGYSSMKFRVADSFMHLSTSGKIIIAGAISSLEIRLSAIPDESVESIGAFVRANVKPGAILLTRLNLPLDAYGYESHRCEEPPRLPTTFDLLRHYRRRRGELLNVYLKRFTVAHNDRYRQVSFDAVLSSAARRGPDSYWNIIGRANPRQGLPTTRRSPRRRKTAISIEEDS